MWALLLLLFSCALARALPATTSFAVIFDCGSTGTRVHVFSWSEAEKSVGGLPDVTAVPGGNKKVTPGIASFEAHPESAGASVSRADVAEVVVRSLLDPRACNLACTLSDSAYAGEIAGQEDVSKLLEPLRPNYL